MTRPSLDQYFMEIAQLTSSRGTCDRRYVGALVVRDRHIIATGYNGSVSGDVHCDEVGHKIENGHCIRTVHAEQNALIQCAKYGESTEGTIIFVTDFPCLICTKLVIQAGISEIVYGREYGDTDYAKELLKSAGISIRKYQIVD
ncbi:deoxycytidylate deaminase [Lactovum miscens]|uniref:dCMP deaminase n=1 Tax=Lactovum miscens TaxID=190387 RepID=A0A841C6J3_9LACT|nr:cytidine/deoxycytidylate deaminase family protein [Lactovum miscens]MBB5888085.1 dCMP deaminase [Lactovum miscens]